MRKVATIFLLSVYMLTFAELHHLLRIPVLVQHFKEHRQLEPSISFMNFLALHYLAPLIIDEDYQRDNQLPFRQADYCITTISVSCECPKIDIEIACDSEEISHHFIVCNEDKLSLLSVADIFQPPRLV